MPMGGVMSWRETPMRARRGNWVEVVGICEGAGIRKGYPQRSTFNIEYPTSNTERRSRKENQHPTLKFNAQRSKGDSFIGCLCGLGKDRRPLRERSRSCGDCRGGRDGRLGGRLLRG